MLGKIAENAGFLVTCWKKLLQRSGKTNAIL